MGLIIPQTHSSLEREFRDSQGQHHLGATSSLGAACPLQHPLHPLLRVSTAPPPPGQSDVVFLLSSFFAASRNPLSPSMVLHPWRVVRQGPWVHPSGRSRRAGTRQGSGFRQRRRGSSVPACQAQQPCPACPCPTAVPLPPPAVALPHPSSLATLCCLTPGAVFLLFFFPWLLLALATPPPLQPPSAHPCSFPPSSHDSQTRRLAAQCGTKRSPGGGSGTALALLLNQRLFSPKKLPWRAAAPSPCARMLCATGMPASSGCILRHGSASAGSSPRSRPTLGCGRECPVPLALQLTPAIHPSLMFNVRK